MPGSFFFRIPDFFPVRIVFIFMAATGFCIAPLKAAHAYYFEDAGGLDHRGQWGIRIDPGITFFAMSDLHGDGGSASLYSFETGLCRGGRYTGNEISLRIRILKADFGTGIMLLSGYRLYSGMEHWKTFADIDIAAPLSPGPGIGGRLGIGAMYDFNRNFGAAISAGVFSAFGSSVYTGLDLSVGVHIRFR